VLLVRATVPGLYDLTSAEDTNNWSVRCFVLKDPVESRAREEAAAAAAAAAARITEEEEEEEEEAAQLAAAIAASEQGEDVSTGEEAAPSAPVTPVEECMRQNSAAPVEMNEMNEMNTCVYSLRHNWHCTSDEHAEERAAQMKKVRTLTPELFVAAVRICC